MSMLLFLSPGPFAYIIMKESTVIARNGLFCCCYYTVAWNIDTHLFLHPCPRNRPRNPFGVSSLSTKRSMSGVVRTAGPQRVLRYSFVFGYSAVVTVCLLACLFVVHAIQCRAPNCIRSHLFDSVPSIDRLLLVVVTPIVPINPPVLQSHSLTYISLSLYTAQHA